MTSDIDVLHFLITSDITTDADCAEVVSSFTGDINVLEQTYTVLHRSIITFRHQTIAALGARGDVDSYKCSIYGGSPLQYAAARQGMVATLWHAFPPMVIRQLNARTCFGDTALHIAVLFRHSDNVQLLLDLGADTTLRDKRGRTAEESACNSRVKAVFAKHAAWKASHRRAWMAAVTSSKMCEK